MKKIILTFIMLSAANFVYSQPDYNNFKHYFGVQLNTGVTFFQLDALKNGFNQYINNLQQQYKIPLSVQHLYPANISWSAYLFWYITPEASLVIGPEYTSTKAYAGYADYAGTMDIKSEMKEIYLSFGIRKHFTEVNYLQPMMGLSLGFTHLQYKEETAISFNYGGIHDSDQSEISDDGYYFEAVAGFTANIDFAVLEVAASYRYVSLLDLNIQPSTYNLRIGLKKGIFK